MANSSMTYRCAYCGSQQIASGTGPCVCSQCGGTQEERNAPLQPAQSRHKTILPVVIIGILLIAGVAYLVFHSSRNARRTTSNAAHDGTTQSRIVVIKNPQVRMLAEGTDYNAADILRTSASAQSPLFDTSLLKLVTPRRLADIEGGIHYVGEVINTSPDKTALAPATNMRMLRNGKTVESTSMSFDDLPPGGHMPAYFEYSGDDNHFDHIVFQWKPTAMPQTNQREPKLVADITSKKSSQSSSTINFTYTFHFTTVNVSGMVTNQGTATADGYRVFLILRDTQKRITGYTMKDFDSPLAPGAVAHFEDISADQWDKPVAAIEVVALTVTKSSLE